MCRIAIEKTSGELLFLFSQFDCVGRNQFNISLCINIVQKLNPKSRILSLWEWGLTRMEGARLIDEQLLRHRQINLDARSERALLPSKKEDEDLRGGLIEKVSYLMKPKKSGNRGFNLSSDIDVIEQERLQIDALPAFRRGMQTLH